MATIARFTCTERTETTLNSPYQTIESPEQLEAKHVEVTLHPVQRADEDNIDWSKYTPSGELRMTITNPDAFNQFVVGQDYYLEIRKVQPNKARPAES